MAPAPYATSKPVVKKTVNPLIEKRPKNFGIGKMLVINNMYSKHTSVKRTIHTILTAREKASNGITFVVFLCPVDKADIREVENNEVNSTSSTVVVFVISHYC